MFNYVMLLYYGMFYYHFWVGLKGKAVEVTHMYTDCLFAAATSSKRTLAPNAGFTSTRIHSLPGYVDINTSESDTTSPAVVVDSNSGDSSASKEEKIAAPDKDTVAFDEEALQSNPVDAMETATQMLNLAENKDLSDESEESAVNRSKIEGESFQTCGDEIGEEEDDEEEDEIKGKINDSIDDADVDADEDDNYEDEVNCHEGDEVSMEVSTEVSMEVSMEEILRRALFRCVKYVAKDHLLPLPVSSLWATVLK